MASKLKSESLKIKKKSQDIAMVMPLSYADYKGNTPAWQNRNKRNKHGKPIYSIPDSVWRKIAEEK